MINHRIRHIDDRHRDELFARRTEFLADPPRADETTSTGRVIFHTVWVHYRDKVQYAESVGPRIEHTFDQVMGRTWEVPVGEGDPIPVPTALLMGAVMAAFDTIANESLAASAPSPMVPPASIDTPTPQLIERHPVEAFEERESAGGNQ